MSKSSQTIDLDLPPRLDDPGRWDVTNVTHVKNGIIQWDWRRLVLYRTKRQRERHEIGIQGLDIKIVLFEQFPYMPLLNKNVADYMYENRREIPRYLRSTTLCFWGTLLPEKMRNEEFVPILFWHRSERDWMQSDLLVEGYGFDYNCAAVLYHDFLQRH